MPLVSQQSTDVISVPISQPASRLSSQMSPDNFGSAYGQAPSQPGVDLWGAMQRRKFIIVLLCIAGAGIGYLRYIKTPKTYSSNIRLQISTQAPPSIVDGNYRLEQKTSLKKHSSLLSSQLVLNSAVESGELGRLSTFKGTRHPARVLKGMIRPVLDRDGEVLTIGCTGRFPADLPVILNSVVESYRQIIADDSENVSEQTLEYIEQIAGELSDSKAKAEEERLRLWQQLDTSSLSEFGTVANPFLGQLHDLKKHLDQDERDLAEILIREKQVWQSMQPDKQSGVIDPLQIRVGAIEAREYMRLSRSAVTEAAVTKAISAVDNEVVELNNQIRQYSAAIRENQITLAQVLQNVGPGHREARQINGQIAFLTTEKQKLQRALDAVLASDAEMQSEGVSVDELRAQEDRDWIRMYSLALGKKAARLKAKVAGTKQEIESVSKKSAVVAEKILRLNVIQKKINTKDQEHGAVLDRLKEMNVMASNYTLTKVRILDEASIGAKIAPSLAKCLTMATMLAGLLGIGLAIMVDRSDMAFRSPMEILDKLQIPVVGKIPKINTRSYEVTKGNPALVTAHAPTKTASEAFRDLRTSLFFRANSESISTLLFTSPSPGDGKSTTIANLAISIAQAGKRVVLVDADLRRPRVSQYFGENQEPGLLDVLKGKAKLSEAIKTTKLQTGLHLLTAGGRPQNPGELVASNEFRAIIQELEEEFDFVLIDSPPTLPVADPASIASMVDGVYLVTRIRKGVKLTTQKAKDSLDRVGANWMGVVINNVDENAHYNEYGYQYGYSYYGGNYGRYYEASNKSYQDTNARIES